MNALLTLLIIVGILLSGTSGRTQDKSSIDRAKPVLQLVDKSDGLVFEFH